MDTHEALKEFAEQIFEENAVSLKRWHMSEGRNWAIVYINDEGGTLVSAPLSALLQICKDADFDTASYLQDIRDQHKECLENDFIPAIVFASVEGDGYSFLLQVERPPVENRPLIYPYAESTNRWVH